MKSKWRVSEKNIAGKIFFEVYQLQDISAPDTRLNRIARGGYWSTRAEAEKLASKLNQEEGWDG